MRIAGGSGGATLFREGPGGATSPLATALSGVTPVITSLRRKTSGPRSGRSRNRARKEGSHGGYAQVREAAPGGRTDDHEENRPQYRHYLPSMMVRRRVCEENTAGVATKMFQEPKKAARGGNPVFWCQSNVAIVGNRTLSCHEMLHGRSGMELTRHGPHRDAGSHSLFPRQVDPLLARPDEVCQKIWG